MTKIFVFKNMIEALNIRLFTYGQKEMVIVQQNYNTSVFHTYITYNDLLNYERPRKTKKGKH